MTEHPDLTSSPDELKLGGNFIIDIPKDIIFPTELNGFLKEKVEFLVYENGILARKLKDAEERIEEQKGDVQSLTTKIERYENNEFSSVANVARCKIVELSKKLRDKNAEAELYKTKCSKLELTIANMQYVEEDKIDSPKVEKPKNELELENKSLQDKVTSLNSKLFEEKNVSFKLKTDLKLANKILQDEIGEQFENLQQISMSAGWRGRSQVIKDLQHKNNELKEKLKLYQDKNGCKPIEQKTSLLQKRLEKIAKEDEALKTENSELRKKLDIAKGRNKILDTENHTWKMKYSSAADMLNANIELIDSLRVQSSSQQQKHNEIMKKKDLVIDKVQKQLKEAKQEYEKQNIKLSNLKSEVEVNYHEDACANNSKQKNDDRALQKLDAERLRLVELTSVYYQRLAQERESRANLDTLYRQERQRAAKLETKLSRIQLEDSSLKGGSYTSILSKHSHPDSSKEYNLELAEEQIKALQSRLDMEKRERELDLQEFCKILQNRNYKQGDEIVE